MKRKVGVLKARKYIESFGVRLNEDINRIPTSHSSDFIEFKLTEEQHKLMYAQLVKWKTWDIWSVTNSYFIWEVGNTIPQQVIGLTSFPRGECVIFLDNSYRG